MGTSKLSTTTTGAAAMVGALAQLSLAAAFLILVVCVFWPLAAGLDMLKRATK